MKRVLIIGAGASGMTAAIIAAMNHAKVTLYEKNDRVGKKILATGNGKCNLSNRNMDINNYYTVDSNKLERCFQKFSVEDTVSFFNSMGLMIREKEGYLYPYCEQASAVLDIMRNQLLQNSIEVFTSVENIKIKDKKNGGFLVVSSQGKREFDSVVLACGSKAGIRNADSWGYEAAKSFGHCIVPVYPALVQVRCKGEFFKSVAGVRCKSKIELYDNNNIIGEETGELQLTDYGISGIPVFQISRLIARKTYEKKNIVVKIDFMPEIGSEEWKAFVRKRMDQYWNCSCEEFLIGMLHKKISHMLLNQQGLKPGDMVNSHTKARLFMLCNKMKAFEVIPTGVNGFEQAQICCGGVDFMELDENLQSIYQDNLYICGEMVDIDGKCGGYNLQWAWTSGYIAGLAASKERK